MNNQGIEMRVSAAQGSINLLIVSEINEQVLGRLV
jgi:hypothetical protein